MAFIFFFLNLLLFSLKLQLNYYSSKSHSRKFMLEIQEIIKAILVNPTWSILEPFLLSFWIVKQMVRIQIYYFTDY